MEEKKESKKTHWQNKKIKLEWDNEMIDVLLDKLNKDKETHYITLTNYTCLIETKDFSYHFLKHLQRPSVFAINREIKRYLDTSLDNTINPIDRNSMKYYSAKIVMRPFYKHKAYNIDINAAYPSCLLLNKLIDMKVFNRLMSLNKDERLASIGMLAARKRIFKIVAGEVEDYTENESEYSKYFFYCVNVISKIIWHCEIISGNSFTYSWVDGLYVTDKSAAQKCSRFLKEKGYRSTISEVTDFNYVPMDDKIRITFIKDKENKLFNIPIENNRLSQILKFIHNETI